jgi:hypothetical protein
VPGPSMHGRSCSRCTGMRLRRANAWCAGGTTTICSRTRSITSSPSTSVGPRMNATSRAPVRSPLTGSSAYLLCSMRRRSGVRGDKEIQFFGDRHEVPQIPRLHPDRLEESQHGNHRGESWNVLRRRSPAGGSSRSGVVFLPSTTEGSVQ